ncbi:MAG: class I SAM-dependent methyltransferase [Xenococcaceae cyanobacterium MO_188.B32]|nr:class I SAM-dependent methyltransferase [Xenococcaceae cyanobacterium MO_188.B32]
MKSFDDYKEFAEAYVKHTESSSHNTYYERPTMFSILSELKFARVLDAGCAGGIYSEWLLDRGADVVAIDINHKMVEFTKQRINNRGKVYQADLDRPLTFLNDNYFDLVVSSLTLHYLPNWTKVFQEFNRLLLPEGLFLFSTHHPFTDFFLFEKIDYFTRELIEDEWYSFGNKPVKVRFYRRPLHDTIEALTKAGFAFENILEPRPTQECQQLYPQDYEKLSTKPWFLIILARKKS